VRAKGRSRTTARCQVCPRTHEGEGGEGSECEGEGEGEGEAVEIAADGSTSNAAGTGQPEQAADLNAAGSLLLQHNDAAGEKLADHPRAGMLFDRLGRTTDASVSPPRRSSNDAGLALMRDGRLKKAKQTLRQALDIAIGVG
jgi:hypothetical protein